MIRTAGVDDIEVVKRLRLAMLAGAPEAFGTTYEQARRSRTRCGSNG